MRRYVPALVAIVLLVVFATQASAMPHWLEEVLKRIGDAYNDTMWEHR